MTVFNKDVLWQIHTAGDGYWSSDPKSVKVTQVELVYVDEEGDFGELQAFFDTTSWNCDKHGLIYTDSQWIDEFRSLMRTLGFSTRACDDISYSEQGMQGYNFVSMDVGEDFLREVEPMHRFVINQVPVNA